MNLVVKTYLAACCLLSLSVSADLIHENGGWRIKPGTASGIIPDSRTDDVLKTIDQAENLSIMREDRAALALWNKLIEKEVGTDAGAVALLERARLYAQRGQFEDTEADLNVIFKSHSDFSGFGQAVQLAFDLAGRYENGERRHLGGWFPWFKDPLHALTIYDSILKVAPVGTIAEESLIHAARLAERENRKEVYSDMLERIVSDYATSKHAPEALERLAKLRGAESLGPDYDQATTLESVDHWRTLADQFPRNPRAQQSTEQIKVLRDRAARARLNLAKFYWFKYNNPEAAKLMANASRTLAPESAAAKEAEVLLAEIQANPTPPKSIADRLLGVNPRPRPAAAAKPLVVSGELDVLGFGKEAPKSTPEPERR